MRMVKAASSGDELGVQSAKLAGTDVIISFYPPGGASGHLYQQTMLQVPAEGVPQPYSRTSVLPGVHARHASTLVIFHCSASSMLAQLTVSLTPQRLGLRAAVQAVPNIDVHGRPQICHHTLVDHDSATTWTLAWSAGAAHAASSHPERGTSRTIQLCT